MTDGVVALSSFTALGVAFPPGLGSWWGVALEDSKSEISRRNRRVVAVSVWLMSPTALTMPSPKLLPSPRTTRYIRLMQHDSAEPNPLLLELQPPLIAATVACCTPVGKG